MAGGEVRSIVDRKTNTLTTLTPIPAGMPPVMIGGVNAKGFVDVGPTSRMHDPGLGSDTHPDIRKLGTSETIAGVSCDDFEITEQGTTPIKACITTALGAFAFPTSGRGMMGGRGSATPGWARAFGDKPVFPLKVWSDDGKIALQVTAIDKTPVPESASQSLSGRSPAPQRRYTAATFRTPRRRPSGAGSGRAQAVLRPGRLKFLL